MDPAMLYILFTLANGVERPMERRFESMEACEDYVKEVIRPNTDKAAGIRYHCANLFKMQSAPEWYTKHAQQNLIHGVLLDPKYAP